MGEVIYVNNAQKGDANQTTGETFCIHCGKEWVGVSPVGVTELEWPDCHTMKGIYKHHLAPVTNE